MPQSSVRKRGIAVIALSAVFPITALAQGRVIKVVASDGQPVVYANVSVEGAITRITDEKGEVSLGAGKRQTVTVRVTRIGYGPWFGKLDRQDTASVLTVTLPSLTQNLSPVTVTGEAAIKSPLQLTGFYDRWMMRQKGTLSAVFIGPEEIETRHPDEISNLLFGLNGVHLDHVCVNTGGQPGSLFTKKCSMNLYAFSTSPGSLSDGPCPMALVIDGVQQEPVPPIDQVVSANDVAGIEVYARGGNMPLSLHVNDTKCGVIAIWTGSRRP